MASMVIAAIRSSPAVALSISNVVGEPPAASRSASSNSRSSSVRARGGGAHENSAAIAAASVADDHVDTVGPYHLRARDRHCLRHRRCSLPGGDRATLRCDPRHACRLPRDGRDVVASASTRGERSMRSELIPIPRKQVRSRFAGGGSRIRTLGPPTGDSIFHGGKRALSLTPLTTRSEIVHQAKSG